MADKYLQETMTPFGLRKFKASALTDDARDSVTETFYGTESTPFADWLAAYNAGKTLFLKKKFVGEDDTYNRVYRMVNYDESRNYDKMTFICLDGDVEYKAVLEDTYIQEWTFSTLSFEVVYVTPFETPYDDIQAAYDAGKMILANLSGNIYALSDYNSSQNIFSFSRIAGYTWIQFRCCKDQYPSTNDWDPNPEVVLMPERNQIAPEYSTASTYAVGDLVCNGGLYRCTTAISTPETWTPAHWTETSVSAELELKADESIYESDYTSDSFSHITFDMLNNASRRHQDITLIKSGSPYGRVTNVYRLDSTSGGYMGQPYTWTFKTMNGSGYRATEDSNETTGLRWEVLS